MRLCSTSALISLLYRHWMSFFFRPLSISAGTSGPQTFVSDFVILRCLSVPTANLSFLASESRRLTLFLSFAMWLKTCWHLSFPIAACDASTLELKASQYLPYSSTRCQPSTYSLNYLLLPGSCIACTMFFHFQNHIPVEGSYYVGESPWPVSMTAFSYICACS